MFEVVRHEPPIAKQPAVRLMPFCAVVVAVLLSPDGRVIAQRRTVVGGG